MKKLMMLALIGGIMAATVGAYAASISGNSAAQDLGSTGDITVNAPGVGNVDLTWEIETDASEDNFGSVTGVTLDVQHAPGGSDAYDVLVRVEDDEGGLLGGSTGTISGNETSIDLSFGDDLDPEDIENAIVVVNEG